MMLIEEPTLGGLLRKAQPRWGNEDVYRVFTKLHKVNISDAQSLSQAVVEGSLNGRLAAAGERRLKPNTLAQLKIQVRGCYKAARSAEEKLHSSRELVDTAGACADWNPWTRKRPPTGGCDSGNSGNCAKRSSSDVEIKRRLANISSRDAPHCSSPMPATSSLPNLPRSREAARAAAPSPLHQVGGRIAGTSQALQGGSQPSSCKPSDANAPLTSGKRKEPRLRRTQSEPNTRKAISPRPNNKAAPAAPAPPQAPPPFIARKAAPMVPGGMRHDDDSLQELLRLADGYIKRGFVEKPRRRSESPGDYPAESDLLLYSAEQAGSDNAVGGDFPAHLQTADDGLASWREAVVQQVQAADAAAGSSVLVAASQKAGMVKMPSYTAQTGDAAEVIVTRPPVLPYDASKPKVRKAHSLATCSTVDSASGAVGDAVSGSPTDADTSAYSEAYDEYTEAQGSARTVDHADVESCTEHSFIGAVLAGDMENEVLRFDGLLNCLDGVAASSVANSEGCSSPREVGNPYSVRVDPSQGSQGGAMASIRSREPFVTEATAGARVHPGNHVMDRFAQRVLERRARWINAYNGPI